MWMPNISSYRRLKAARLKAALGLCLLLATLILAALFAPIAQAQLPGAPLNVPAVIKAETVAPAAGKKVTVAFIMTPKPTWHGYWENGGDAGVGMQLEWNLPPGVTAGPLRYPVPKPLIISGLMNYVYEKPYTLLADLSIDPKLAKGTALPIKVRADWLACTDRICVPEGDDLALMLTVGDGAIDSASRPLFDGFRAALPAPLDQQAVYSASAKFIEISVPFPVSAPLSQPYFFALTPNIIDYPVTQSARRVGNMLIIKAGLRGSGKGNFSGVLHYGEGQGLLITARPGTVPSGGSAVAAMGQTVSVPGAKSTINFALIACFALLGGLILNLMPCVFPILGLKALSLAKMGGDSSAAKRDALAYTGGVILSTLALGGVMLALRAAGEQVGWAFQLQEPRVVLLLVLLMAAVTINLWGGFELAVVNTGSKLTQQSGVAGSFWTGVLAAVVATPCTGPFMAAAMGAALLLPTAQALFLFALLGLGLSLPYLGIAYSARARRLLPKPGPWLGTFRKAMAVPMGLTLAALLWLLWRLSGQFGLVLGAAGVAAITVVLLFIGKLQRRGAMVPPVMVVTVLALAAIAVIALPRSAVEAKADRSKDVVAVEPFSENLLAKYRGEGRPVFAYFTADWCVTCKVNEAASIQRESTAAAFKAAGVKVLEGDFTRRNPQLGRMLADYGRSGVPLYLYYPKDKEALILPQILTSQILADTIAQ
jgi:DsbC/DsbD-like thiol-disulfide interchange protein/cytochrome c biogenesis protein CcdA